MNKQLKGANKAAKLIAAAAKKKAHSIKKAAKKAAKKAIKKQAKKMKKWAKKAAKKAKKMKKKLNKKLAKANKKAQGKIAAAKAAADAAAHQAAKKYVGPLAAKHLHHAIAKAGGVSDVASKIIANANKGNLHGLKGALKKLNAKVDAAEASLEKAKA